MSQPQRTILWLLVPVAFAFRLIFAAGHQLVPDEAFYWVLSRHLSTGYLDHPPMVAYLIKLGTFLFGPTEVGVRCMAALLAFGALLVLLRLARRVLPDQRAIVFLGLIWLCSPLFAGIATIMTPDTPSIFFSLCAMAIAVIIALKGDVVGSASADAMTPAPNVAKRKKTASAKADPTRPQSPVLSPQSSLPLWLAFGLFTGLAMLSKYTAVLPAGAVVLALMTSPAGRKEFRKPGIWLAAIVALIVFSPVIHWNMTHQWASFKFQLHHGLDSVDSANGNTGAKVSHGQIISFAEHFSSLAIYLVGQVGMFTPIFFIFGLVVLLIDWRRYRRLSLADRILVWSATLPLIFFGFAAFKSKSPGEANWPAFGYFPMSLLLLAHVAKAWKAKDVRLLKIGCVVAVLIAIPLHAPDLLYRAWKWHDKFPNKLNEFYGWREMGRAVAANRSDALVIAGKHQDAGELSFYMPGQPDVWVYPIIGADGKPITRPTAFDYFPDRPDLAKVDRALFFYGDLADFCRNYGFKPLPVHFDFRIPIHGRVRARSYFLVER